MRPKLLVVDDQLAIRIALERWFSLHGFDVECALDGLEALSLCRDHLYDAILLDLEMPRLRGMDAVTRLRQLQPQAPVIILTSHPEEAPDALARGARRVLVKPLQLQALEQHVREVLNGAPDVITSCH